MSLIIANGTTSKALVVIPEGQLEAGRMKRTRSALPIASVLAFLVFACVDSTGPANPGNQANGRITIVNDPATLATQIAYSRDSIPIDATGVGYPAPPARAPSATAPR